MIKHLPNCPAARATSGAGACTMGCVAYAAGAYVAEREAVAPKRRRLVNADYTVTNDTALVSATSDTAPLDGWSIMKRWEALCREFVASLPADVELTDVSYLCASQFNVELSRRILRERKFRTDEAQSDG